MAVDMAESIRGDLQPGLDRKMEQNQGMGLAGAAPARTFSTCQPLAVLVRTAVAICWPDVFAATFGNAVFTLRTCLQETISPPSRSFAPRASEGWNMHLWPGRR
jgi:hypothetical protein